MDNTESIETILINLKMISRIRPGDKLYIEEGLIKIDTPKLIQGIYRWMNDFSRTKTMNDIDIIANTTINAVENIINKSTIEEQDNRTCQNILREITNSIIGLQHLKSTYLEDTFIQSKLDIINEKLLECKNTLSRILMVNNNSNSNSNRID